MADESDAVRASRETKLAIEILTVLMPAFWERNDPVTWRQAHEHVDRVRREEGPDTIFAGQLTLSMLLLKKLAEQRGATRDTLMAEIGTILQEVSRDLPS